MPKPASRSMWSLGRSLLEPHWRKDETHLFQMLPYGYVVEDDVISTRDGGLLAAAEITGINANTMDEPDFAYLAERFERVLRNTEREFGLYIHRLSVPAEIRHQVSDETGFAGAVASAMKANAETGDLRERRIVLSVVLQQGRDAHAKRLFGFAGASIEEERHELLDRLNGFFTTLTGTLGKERVHRLTISEGRWLGYYGMLLNGRYQPIVHSNICEPIAFNIGQESVLFKSKHGELVTIDGSDRQVNVYSLKNYPGQSFPGIFDGLDLPVDIVITQSWLPLTRVQAQEKTRVKKGQMRGAGDQAKSLEDDLTIFADEVASGNLTAGKHHLSICVFGTASDLKVAEQHIVGEIQIAGGTIKRERLSQRAVYFAQHPGNFALRPREELITEANFADMVAFHMRPKGVEAHKLPWDGPLATFPTTQGDVYDLSLHLPMSGEDAENLPPGHTIVLGPNGSGKTVIAMLLAATAVAQGARVIALDKDRAMEAPLRALGARYTRVRVGEPTGMNPFGTETDEAGTTWLANWVTALLSYDEKLSAEQKEEINRACQANAALPAHLQNFDELRNQFKAFDDGGELHRRCGEWCSGGRLGWMFGEGGEDPFAAGDTHLAFDISEVLEDQLVRMAWVSYVMRQIARRNAEKQPTLFVVDEAWEIAGNEFGAQLLKEAYTTFRKLNVAMMIMTQIPDHILSSAASKSILENTSMTLCFPSRRGNTEDYRKIGLNDAELTALRAHDGDRVVLMKKGDEAVWLDVDLTELGPLLRVLSGSDGKTFSNADWRQTPDFWKEIT